MKKSLLTSLVLALSTLVPAVMAATPVHADDLPPRVLISEIQTSSAVSSSDEFVELYNPSDETIDLDGWRVDFVNDSGMTERTLATFEDVELSDNSFFIISREGYLQNPDALIVTAHGLNVGGGTIRLIDHTGAIVDEVGYGTPVYYAGQPAPAPEADESITRCFGEDGITDSNNNAADFISNPLPLPGDRLECPPPEPVNACTGIMLSEIGANLPDSEQFIEIHNPTDTSVELWGCAVQTNRNDNAFIFDDTTTLAPNDYYAIFVQDSGLTLTKTTSGTVYFLSSDMVEVDVQQYENLRPDTSWAWFGENDWRQTYHPTPGQANSWQEFVPCPEGQERNPDTGRCRNIAAASPDPDDCGPGRERNPATNRCRNISTDTGLQPCGPGRERNPETNRCRNIASAASGLTPCRPGQERNPETNRCRNVASASSSLQPCRPGQERNPETNRCRNIVSSNTAAMPDVRDIRATTDGNPFRWWVAGAAVAIVAAYAIFEWRRDIAAIFGKIVHKGSR